MALQFDGRQKAGLIVFVVTNMIAADELVPGWGFHMGLPRAALYALALVGGAVGGALVCGPFAIAGAVGGAIAALGALLTTIAYLSSVTTSYSAIMALVAMAGALPGIAIGFGLFKLQQKRAAPVPGPAPK